jgi:TRAP-type C4-dicarboxylate transport system permease small subunit
MNHTKLIARLHKFFDHLVDYAALVSGVILGLVTVLVCTDIVMRYFFNKPIQGALESSEYGLLFLTLLAAAWLVRKEKHVRMELLVHQLKPTTQAYINGITSIICALICGIVTYYGVLVVIDRFQTGHRLTTTLEPLSYPLMSIIPLCFFLLIIQFMISAYGYFGEAKALGKNRQQSNPAR